MPTNELIENDVVVDVLSKAIKWGGANLRDVPPLIKRILLENRWQKRIVQETGEIVTFDKFVEFVTTPPLEGLGADLKLIKRMCDGDAEALDLIDRATVEGQGARIDLNTDTSLYYNEVDRTTQGTSKEYAIRKLRKDRPDLHAKVLANELTPHAAMIEAGFRQKTIAIPLDTYKAAQIIRRNFTTEQIDELIDELTND